MDDFTATMIAEGVEDADTETKIAAWQHLVDTGLCWKLQGWFGRTALSLLEDGVLEPPVREDDLAIVDVEGE